MNYGKIFGSNVIDFVGNTIYEVIFLICGYGINVSCSYSGFRNVLHYRISVAQSN